MSGSLEFSFHAWRGFGRDIELDLFRWRCRFGVVTVAICRVCMLSAYWKLKRDAQRLEAELTNALRDAARLRRSISDAVDKVRQK